MNSHECFKDQPNATAAAECGAALAPPQPTPAQDESEQRAGSSSGEAQTPSKPSMNAAQGEPSKVLSRVEDAPKLAPEIDDRKPQTEAAGEAFPAMAAAERTARPRGRATLLAACLLFSAAFGAMIGVAIAGLVRPASAPTAVAGRTSLDELQALKENVVQARVELAMMKSALDAANRSANAQFTRIAERIERMERIQAEPTAKLNKAIETLDRLSRVDPATQKETTGSVAPSQTVAGGAPANAGALEGWVVRDVRRGAALLESRRLGLIEVEKDDVVPGLGRIEAIRKQDGHWIVETAKGTILPRR